MSSQIFINAVGVVAGLCSMAGFVPQAKTATKPAAA